MKPLVLIASHEPQTRDLLETTLSPTYRVLATESVPQAKFFYQRFGQHVAGVIADAQMPIPDGVSLPSWLLGQSPPPAVIVVGGKDHLSEAARELWADAPGIIWLDKPVSVPILCRALQAVRRQ